MLVLFDQGTPIGIRSQLSEHAVETARERGWSTLTNGKLLESAEQAGFQVLVTPDKNLIYQQNLAGRKIAIVALGQNRWKLIQPTLGQIAKAINEAKPGTYTLVEIPATVGQHNTR